MYNLAGVEDEIPESQLPTSRTNNDQTQGKNGKSQDIPQSAIQAGAPSNPDTPTTEPQSPGFFAILGLGDGDAPTPAQDSPVKRPTIETASPDSPQTEVQSPTSWFGGSPSKPAFNGDRPSQEPESPTSFLGYFFGGGDPSKETPTAVADPEADSNHQGQEGGGFGSFLMAMIGGGEGDLKPSTTMEEEKPRNIVPQPTGIAVAGPAYMSNGKPRQGASSFTDADARNLVEDIEEGRQPGIPNRGFVFPEMDVKMKLNEAKVSMKKLRALQKETEDLLGTGASRSRGLPDPTFSPLLARKTTTLSERIKTEIKHRKSTIDHPPNRYRARLSFDPIGAPISDRIKSFPQSLEVQLHSRQMMPASSVVHSSGRLARDVVVVSSVEARSLRTSEYNY